MVDVLKITIKPTFQQLSKRAMAAHKKMLDQKRESVRMLGRRYIEIARDEAPKRTGTFAKSLIYRTFIKGETMGFTAHSKQPLGTFITEGTKPHIIRARKSVLYFSWPNGPRGAGMYAYRFVHHPGTQRNPYHERAFRTWRPEAIVEIRKISKAFVMVLQGR